MKAADATGSRSPAPAAPHRVGRAVDRARTAASSRPARRYLRGTHGQLWGRPADGHESKYLLTGMSRVRALRRHDDRPQPQPRPAAGVTSTPARRSTGAGKTVCPNSLEMRLEVADEAHPDGARARAARPGDPAGSGRQGCERVATPAEDLTARRHALETALGTPRRHSRA